MQNVTENGLFRRRSVWFAVVAGLRVRASARATMGRNAQIVTCERATYIWGICLMCAGVVVCVSVFCMHKYDLAFTCTIVRMYTYVYVDTFTYPKYSIL